MPKPLPRLALALIALVLGAHGLAQTLTLYSGRGEALVQPLIDRFVAETGINVAVRYGGTAELAVLILEEGRGSPADLFWGQDAGALGALAKAGRLSPLPDELVADLPSIFRSRANVWLATSGRSRVLAYSPERTQGRSAPGSIFDLSDPVYGGRVGWAPTNGSFQAFVTALRFVHGEGAAEAWLRAMMANEAQAYRNNTALIEAIAAGEIDYAITNNYYLLRFVQNDPSYPVAQRTFTDGDIGNLVNVAGGGVVNTSRNPELALRFLAFLLDEASQAYFTAEVGEYPVVAGIPAASHLESFEVMLAASPEVDLDVLEDLEGTLELLRKVGLL
jgi:iron(III) transport system substrate-binding protein